MTISCFHAKKFIFQSCHSRSTPFSLVTHAVHCQLTYEEDNTIDNHSSEDDILAHHLPSITEEDNGIEEHFPTISLDDDFWIDLCIHEDAQHDFCTYPCPYDLNQLHLTQEDVQYIDLSDILDFPDVMLPADDDMPSLEGHPQTLKMMLKMVYKSVGYKHPEHL